MKNDNVKFEETSDWNMGVELYRKLSTLKDKYFFYEDRNDIRNCVKTLGQEIDLMNKDLGDQNLKFFRMTIDNLRQQTNMNINDLSKRNLFVVLNNLKRQVWDVETSMNITRPKGNVDLSNNQMARIQ